MAKWYYVASATPSTDSSKKHYIKTGVSCSAVSVKVGRSGGKPQFYFSPGGSPTEFGHKSDVSSSYYYSDGDTLSQTIGVTSRADLYIYCDGWSEGGPARNVSAAMAYGSKATPTGTGSVRGGYVNPFQDKTFNFYMDYVSNVDAQYTIQSGTFSWCDAEDTSTWHTQAFTGSSVTIPANTFTSGHNYLYKANVVLDDNSTCEIGQYTFMTVDGVPTATPSQPSNVVIHGETDFVWNYSNTRGTPQYAYDLQMSNDSGSTWETLFSHVVTADTRSASVTGITAGTKLWRVRVYNQDDVASEWSETASFICNVPPSAPEITSITGTGRKTIAWEATDQVAFHLVVEDMTTGAIIHDSGDVYSSNTQYLINDYLPNGGYTVKVKIINIYGKESPYASAQFTQSSGTLSPTINVEYNEASGQVLITASDAEATGFYLKRNGELIAQFSGGTYFDYFASGPTEYELISVDANDNFGTASGTIDVHVRSARIIRKNGQIIDVSERWNGMFTAEMAEERRYQANEFLGASMPSHTFAKMRTKRYTFVFDDKDRLASGLLGEVVFYADQFGNGDWVVPVGFTRTDHWFGGDTSMQLELTEHDEGISYAV